MSFGAADYAHDIRLACHGLDKDDNDFVVGLIGRVPFHGFRFAGKRFDCGDKLGFLQANIAFALERSDLREELSDYLRALGRSL